MPDLTAKEILARYHNAMLAKAPDQLADLYAADAVHEVPFDHTGGGTLRGRETIRERYRAAWAAAPINIRAISNVRLHETSESGVVIVEHDIELTNTINGKDFVAGGVLVMRTQGGAITHMRDYIDSLTIATELGRPPLQS